MEKSSIFLPKELSGKPDPFSRKGGTVLFWFLAHQENQARVPSINALSNLLRLSPGTIHRTLQELTKEGIFKTVGLRTAKHYYLEEPKELFLRWIRKYRGFQALRKLQLAKQDPKKFSKINFEEYEIVPALHSAAKQIFHSGTANLNTYEGYVLKWDKVKKITAALDLMEMDRGYEVLLLEPYYLHMLQHYFQNREKPEWNLMLELLTMLELCHFPLRGQEQAEVLLKKSKMLKKLCSWKEIDGVLGSK